MHKQRILEKLKKNLGVAVNNIKLKDIPQETYNLFLQDCIKHNKFIAYIILGMVFFMESLMLFFYLAEKYFVKQNLFFPQYVYLYTSMMLLSLFFIILLSKIKKPSSNLMLIEMSIIAVLGVWSAVFSAIDVMNGFSSYLFIQIMIINSLLFKLPPFEHCIINISTFLVYMAVIVSADLSFVTTFAELINPFLMLIAACIVVFLNHNMKFQSYIDKNILKGQCQKLEYYANNDFLTNIGNRKSIIEHLDNMLLGKLKNVACIMVDIDDFKLYNDTYGHLVGDTCLIKFTNIIENHVKAQNGKIGRYGGEEFLILFEGKTEQEVVNIANELLNMVRQENMEFYSNANQKIVTISMGICFAETTDNWNRNLFLECADKALYQAKKEGKNKVVIYNKNAILKIS